MPTRFNKELLDQILERDSATLIGDYDHINRETRIHFTCGCGVEFSKTVRMIVQRAGALCHKCTMNHMVETQKRTMLKTYGFEYALQSQEVKDKIKATNLEKYGVECVLQSQEVKDKIKATNLEKYGFEYALQSQEVKDKMKETMIQTYGVEYALQSKDFQEKMKTTNLERLGVVNPFQSEEIKSKSRATNLDKYGFEYASQSQEVKDKMKETNLERLGVEVPAQSKEVQAKMRASMLENYGVEHALQSELFRNKFKNTCIEKFGVEYPSQNQEVMERTQKNAKLYKEFVMPSGEVRKVQGYEPFALIELLNIYNENQIKSDRKDVPRILYHELDGNERYHFPDFFIPHENKIIEVKSTWTYNIKEDNVLLKKKTAEEDGFLYEIWCFNEKAQRVDV